MKQKDRMALDRELEFSQLPPLKKKTLRYRRSCRCHPSLEIVDEYTVIVDHKRITSAVMQNRNRLWILDSDSDSDAYNLIQNTRHLSCILFLLVLFFLLAAIDW